MNEVQLKTFLELVKTLNYSEVGKKMNVTQPTVTSRIKALEAELSCKLFIRNGHEIELTKEGHVFLTYAESILASIAHAKEMTKLISEPTVRIGFSPGYAYSFIVEILNVAQSLETFNVQIIEGHDSFELNNKLISGETDLVFNREELKNQPGIESEYLFDNKLVLIAGLNHPLAKKENIALNDIQGETVITFRRNTILWDKIINEIVRVPNIKRIDVDNSEMMKQAVENNLGIGIIPFLGIDKSYKNRLAVKVVKELYSIPNKVFVQYRKNLSLEKTIKKIIYAMINHKYDSTFEGIDET